MINRHKPKPDEKGLIHPTTFAQRVALYVAHGKASASATRSEPDKGQEAVRVALRLRGAGHDLPTVVSTIWDNLDGNDALTRRVLEEAYSPQAERSLAGLRREIPALRALERHAIDQLFELPSQLPPPARNSHPARSLA